MKHFSHSLLWLVCLWILTVWLSCSKPSQNDNDYVVTSHIDGSEAFGHNDNPPKDYTSLISHSETEYSNQSTVIPNSTEDFSKDEDKENLAGKFQIIAGNYLEASNANAAVGRLKKLGFPITWNDRFINSPYHTVIVQYTFTMAEAQAITKHLRAAGIECYVNEKRFGPAGNKSLQQADEPVIPDTETIAVNESPTKEPTTPDPNFDNFVDLYNVILAEHMLMWQERSKELHDKNFESLSYEEQKAIRKSIPVVISGSKMYDPN